MSVKHMSEKMLAMQYERIEKELKDYYHILSIFPDSSPLGRLSIMATIKHKEKQLKKIEQQMMENFNKDGG